MSPNDWRSLNAILLIVIGYELIALAALVYAYGVQQ